MKTSVYLSRERAAAIEASGLTLIDLIDLGLQSAQASGNVSTSQRRREQAMAGSCPHPPARRAKGLCMACGTHVG